MKPLLSPQRNAAMSLFEVGVVVAVVMVLAAFLLPALTAAKKKSSKIGCVNNLKQVGLAYRIWAGDNSDVFPMGVSVTDGGSMEMILTGDVVQTFQVMSNEFGTTKIVICPEDKTHTNGTNFGTLTTANISYFISVDATNETNPQMILSGDSNFEISGVPVKGGLQAFWTNTPVAWTANRHKRAGYILLADGSVQATTTPGLAKLFQQTGLATNRLAIP